MAVQNIDMRDVDGTVVLNVDQNGAHVDLGNEFQNGVQVINPPGSAGNLYLTKGVCGLLKEAGGATDAQLQAKYPFIAPGESKRFDSSTLNSDQKWSRYLEMRAATGVTNATIRIDKQL